MRKNNIAITLSTITLAIVLAGCAILNLLRIKLHRDRHHEDESLRVHYFTSDCSDLPFHDQTDESGDRFPTLMSLKKLTCNINLDFIGRKCPINRRPVQRNSTFAA